MLKVPENTTFDVTLGSADHLPKFDTLPEEFQRQTSPYCRAVQGWFYRGGRPLPNGIGIEIDGVKFYTRPGVDTDKAIRAIRAALCAFEPSHEHKVAGCGFMLSEWFEESP